MERVLILLNFVLSNRGISTLSIQLTHNQLATFRIFFCTPSLKVEEDIYKVVHIVPVKYSNLALGEVRWKINILTQLKTHDKHGHHSSRVSSLKLHEYIHVCYTKTWHTLENPKR
jgi:hypothetical protein